MKHLLLLLAVGFFFGSCSKEQEGEGKCFDGVVVYGGDPAADGLGWLIMEDDSVAPERYVPQNLANAYMKDGLKVSVCLQETEEKLYCFCAQPLPKYRITSIRTR
ncbi:MAG TPA: hypothetical protein VMR70_10335 [Flavisolibacter sp.]|nr:hypothetical protein [Flavisolibacter sp.]